MQISLAKQKKDSGFFSVWIWAIIINIIIKPRFQTYADGKWELYI